MGSEQIAQIDEEAQPRSQYGECLVDTVSVWDDEKVLKMDIGHGCTTP